MNNRLTGLGVEKEHTIARGIIKEIEQSRTIRVCDWHLSKIEEATVRGLRQGFEMGEKKK